MRKLIGITTIALLTGITFSSVSLAKLDANKINKKLPAHLQKKVNDLKNPTSTKTIILLQDRTTGKAIPAIIRRDDYIYKNNYNTNSTINQFQTVDTVVDANGNDSFTFNSTIKNRETTPSYFGGY